MKKKSYGKGKQADTLSFNQDVYNAGDEIIANGTGSVIAVENGISSVSQSIDPLVDSLDLGQAKNADLVLVTFTFIDNSIRSFLIAIGDNSSTVQNSVYEATSAVSTIDQNDIFIQVFKFFKDKPVKRFDPFVNGAIKYCKANAISEVHNVSFCLAAAIADGSILALDTMCEDMTVDNLKQLTTYVLNELFDEMLAANYITKDQRDALEIDSYLSLAKLLQKDCSAFFDLLADKIDKDDLKIAIKYEGQLCSSTIAVIKTLKTQ